MISRAVVLFALAFCALAFCAPAPAVAAEECELPRPAPSCFGIESVEASLSTTKAGGHPDFSFAVSMKRDPLSEPNVFGLKDSYAATRDLRFELPPGLIGDPNVLGVSQQCTAQELISYNQSGGGCPNGSQIGISTITAYTLDQRFREPLYMMAPPGGDVVARVGTIAGLYPTFVDLRVRSESDYSLVADVTDASAAAKLIELESTLWGVPFAESHDTERCTPSEAFLGCVESPARPPDSPPDARPLAFMTNPTRCGVPLTMTVSASSWVEPDRLEENQAEASLPEITECNRLPFGPSLTVAPTNRHTSAPTGLDMTIRLPASDGVGVLEPAQIRDIHIDLPKGFSINPGAAEGLDVCSPAQVHFKERVAAECPDAAKMASTEFEVGGLPRRLKGAIYLREPEQGNLFRIWVVADDLGAHVKLPGQLNVDRQTGQVKSVVLDNPQVPLREVKIEFKSGFRAPLLTPASCGDYLAHYEFIPWSDGPPAVGDAPMRINEGCTGGGFSPELSAGSTDASAGAHSPFVFEISRKDSEANLAGLNITLPRGISATFAGIPHCEGAAAQSGVCPPGSRIGSTTVADGSGPNPLWVPQPGKDPTAIYLGGPYKGAPLSIVAVVPAQAGPFDLGDEVVRSAIYVDPETAQATTKADPLPQIIEGIPITYKAVQVNLDHSRFMLNPTSCAQKQTRANLTSTGGASADPTASYRAVNCAGLSFKPKLGIKLAGGTHRGAHPRLTATLKMPPAGANIASVSTALPDSEFVENAHFKTICTRVQFAAHQCPSGSIYGRAVAITPLFDHPLEGPVYLRSSNNPLPDLVVALKGPPSLPIEVNPAAKIDTVNGGLRASFETIPDAPLTKVVLRMQGGTKGLIVNSTNLCAATHRATVKFKAHNGKTSTLRPALRASCKKAAHKRQKR